MRSFCVLVVLAALLPATASAQDGARLTGDRGLDLHLFRPAVDSKGILTVNGTDILGHNDFSFGLILDAGFGLLPFDGFVNDQAVASDGAERSSRIAGQLFTGTLHFNYGLANLVVVGAQVPIQVVTGQSVSVPGVYNDAGGGMTDPPGLEFQGLGNITIHGKVRLTRVERDDVGLAALLHVELPTGSAPEFAGSGFALWPMVAAEVRPIREIRLALNLGTRLSFGDHATFPVGGRTDPMGMNALNPVLADPGTDVEFGHMLTFGFGAGFRIADAAELAVEAYGTQLLSGFGDVEALSVETIAGLKIFVERNSYLVLGGGVGLPNVFSDTGGFQSADARAMLGFVFEPSIGDRDGDGYKDDDDQCPDEPEDFDDFADEDGCPDPDNDRDGILDVDDECPMVPEDRDGDADDDGCPEGNPGDRDGDGILDQVDECPDDPEDRDGFQDEDGCPDPDNDQDGILDVDDMCPNDPEDVDGFEDLDGCPDPDNDQDRILDVDDACPNDPETYNGTEDEDGCPDTGITTIEGDDIIILEEIYFETDSAAIMRQSFHVVDAIAATLHGNPQLTLVEIQGHADERGSDEYNIRLTRDRAASVRSALVDRGVAPNRMRSAGYGERCPVDPRHNAAAWDQNRRVEIKILENDGSPTTVDLICPAGRELVPR